MEVKGSEQGIGQIGGGAEEVSPRIQQGRQRNGHWPTGIGPCDPLVSSARYVLGIIGWDPDPGLPCFLI